MGATPSDGSTTPTSALSTSPSMRSGRRASEAVLPSKFVGLGPLASEMNGTGPLTRSMAMSRRISEQHLPKRSRALSIVRMSRRHDPYHEVDEAGPTNDDPQVVASALEALPLFRGCKQEHLQLIAERAGRRRLPVGAELSLNDDGPMIVVNSGNLLVRVSAGRSGMVGPGAALNAIGMLNLNQDAEVQQAAGAQQDGSGTVTISEELLDSPHAEEACCIGNLCPHVSARSSSKPRARKAAEVRRVAVIENPRAPVQGASQEKNRRISLAQRHERKQPHSTASIAVITLSLVMEVMEDRLDSESWARFCENRDALRSRWLLLLRRSPFPGAPLEVAWALAEAGEHREFVAGEMIVHEGDAEEEAGAIVIMETGQATVEKIVVGGEVGTSSTVVAGYLREGAIIGNVCLVGSCVPRPASVRALTATSVVCIPPKAIEAVLERFPGTIMYMQGILKETASMLQPSLPAHTDVLASLKLFASCNFSFLRAVAGIAERRVFYCGDIVKAQGTKDATLYVVEFGFCSVDKVGAGRLAVAEATMCVGEQTLLGISQVCAATVRVATPLAMMLMISPTAFNSLLARFPEEQRRFQRMAEIKIGIDRGSDVASFPVFRSCSQNFTETIGKAFSIKYYLPGQTVMVEGSVDAQQMFVLKGGRAGVQVQGKAPRGKGSQVAELPVGQVFGEFAMLGLVRRRTATIRALTLCLMFEIPRSAFLAALEENPGDRNKFERLTKKYGVADSSVRWPIFADFPANLFYLVNLYADRHVTQGKWACTTGEALPVEAATLVLKGRVRIMSSRGQQLEEFTTGQCFNEQLLVGFPHLHGELVPEENTEVQIIKKDVFDKIMAEVPQHRESVERSILREMAGKAVEKLGLPRGSTGVLHFSSLFRNVEESFNEKLSAKLEERIYKAGSMIVEEGATGDSMYLVIMGKVGIESKHRPSLKRPYDRQVIGEAVLLGLADAYPVSFRATTDCLVQTLGRHNFQEALQGYKEENKLFGALRNKVAQHSLENCLARNPNFKGANPEFISIACAQAEDLFYATGEEIVTRNEVCKLGESSVYLLVSGEADAEGLFSQHLGRLHPGDMFGEAGALGLAKTRNATVRAMGKGITHCAQLNGASIEAAVNAFPELLKEFRRIYEQRLANNMSVEERRMQWVHEVVVPALHSSAIFAKLPASIVEKVAMPLVEMKYKKGDLITQVGEPAVSTLFLLEGGAEVFTKAGKLVGVVGAGAILGELTALGLLEVRTATVRATEDCRMLQVPTASVMEVLAACDAPGPRLAFDQLRTQKLKQVEECVPFGALNLGLKIQDACARVMCLQAERLELPPDTIMEPTHDASPSGPHFSILTRGRLNVLLGCEERPVLTIKPVEIFPEGLAARYKAHARSVQACEIYRISEMDLFLAVGALPKAFKCFILFEALWKQAQERLRTNLDRTRGVEMVSKAASKAAESQVSAWLPSRSMMSIDTEPSTWQDAAPAGSDGDAAEPGAGPAPAPAPPHGSGPLLIPRTQSGATLRAQSREGRDEDCKQPSPSAKWLQPERPGTSPHCLRRRQKSPKGGDGRPGTAPVAALSIPKCGSMPNLRFKGRPLDPRLRRIGGPLLPRPASRG